MKHKHLLTLLQEGYTTIEVTFEAFFRDDKGAIQAHGKTYTYKAKMTENIQKGDAVVVDSPSSGLCVVHVVNVHKVPKIDLDAPWTYKWIVQKVDRSKYDATLEQEAKFAEVMLEIERARQRELLMEQFTANLPEGSEARRLFDEATSKLLNGGDLSDEK